MPTFTLLHCAEPFLASAREGERAPERARDRLDAFERAVDDARNASAEAVLIGGRLLAPPPHEPLLVHQVEGLLERARGGGAAVVLTCERGEEGWHAYLAARGLLTLLVPSSDSASPLPSVEPARGLRIVGLGRPPTEAVLAARLERASELPRERGPIVALLATGAFPLSAPGLEWLTRTAVRVADYTALGGGRSALTMDTVHDPGPLTRTGAEDDEEPGFTLVKVGGPEGSALPGPRPVLRTIDSGDRAHLAIELDLDPAASSGGVASLEELEALLYAELLARRTKGRPLLHVRLRGETHLGRDAIDVARLEGVAVEALDPIETRIEVGNPVAATVTARTAPSTSDGQAAEHVREALEKTLLLELAHGDEALASVAALALAHGPDGDEPEAPAAERLKDAMTRLVERAAEGGDGPRGRTEHDARP